MEPKIAIFVHLRKRIPRKACVRLLQVSQMIPNNEIRKIDVEIFVSVDKEIVDSFIGDLNDNSYSTLEQKTLS